MVGVGKGGRELGGWGVGGSGGAGGGGGGRGMLERLVWQGAGTLDSWERWTVVDCDGRGVCPDGAHEVSVQLHDRVGRNSRVQGCLSVKGWG